MFPEWYSDLIVTVAVLFTADVTWDVLKVRRRRVMRKQAKEDYDVKNRLLDWYDEVKNTKSETFPNSTPNEH